MTAVARATRIGILWRGDRRSGPRRPEESRGLGPLFDALESLGAEVVPVIFEEGAEDEVLAQVLGLDGVLVWVNPIQDGATRGTLDGLLREAVASGVYVSADPAVIARMGTKAVLVHTRELGWGSDTELYPSAAEFEQRFPRRLARHRRLVLKQGRGNGGNGVWLVELSPGATGEPTDRVRVQEARASEGSGEEMSLAAFVERCQGYFAWSGVLVDQEFQERLAEGMVRCYLSQARVVGFAQQWPRGLLDAPHGRATPVGPATRPPMAGPDAPEFQELRASVERGWVPQMQALLHLETESLPVIWDADFLYGPKAPAGADTFVLCEINASAVWPFPPSGIPTVAATALTRSTQASYRRLSSQGSTG